MDGAAMKAQNGKGLGRRQFFRALGIGAVTGAIAPLGREARADTETNAERRKSRYQANSPEIQTYYRVNRYPPSSTKGR